MVVWSQERLAFIELRDADRDACRFMGFNMRFQLGDDVVWILVRDEPACDLRAGFCRQDGLDAFAGKPAGDAVDFECRADPCPFDKRIAFFAEIFRNADCLLFIFQIEIKRGEFRTFLI